MRRDRLKTAIAECDRFLEKVRKVEAGPLMDQSKTNSAPHPSVAACKRSSMDLTRALADLRRDDYEAAP